MDIERWTNSEHSLANFGGSRVPSINYKATKAHIGEVVMMVGGIASCVVSRGIKFDYVFSLKDVVNEISDDKIHQLNEKGAKVETRNRKRDGGRGCARSLSWYSKAREAVRWDTKDFVIRLYQMVFRLCLLKTQYVGQLGFSKSMWQLPWEDSGDFSETLRIYFFGFGQYPKLGLILIIIRVFYTKHIAKDLISSTRIWGSDPKGTRTHSNGMESEEYIHMKWEILLMEEIPWRQKYKALQLRGGDRNMKFSSKQKPVLRAPKIAICETEKAPLLTISTQDPQAQIPLSKCLERNQNLLSSLSQGNELGGKGEYMKQLTSREPSGPLPATLIINAQVADRTMMTFLVLLVSNSKKHKKEVHSGRTWLPSVGQYECGPRTDFTKASKCTGHQNGRHQNSWMAARDDVREACN
ncbi:hypothetical protein Ancab_029080 [Ancistrocladus abbreviatus]